MLCSVELYIVVLNYTLLCSVVLKQRSRGGSRGVQRVPWNPPFERASLTRDTLIEQSNRDTLIEQSQ